MSLIHNNHFNNIQRQLFIKRIISIEFLYLGVLVGMSLKKFIRPLFNNSEILRKKIEAVSRVVMYTITALSVSVHFISGIDI